MSQIEITCPCSGCAQVFMSVTPKAGHTLDQLKQAWKNDSAGSAGMKFCCNTCGCDHQLVDDGTPVAEGGSITTSNKAAPKVDSLGATQSGGVAGGTTVQLNGHAFQAATPTVKFNGVAGTSLSVSDDGTLTVDTPAGTIAVLLAEYHTKLAHGTVTDGPFTVGETVTGATSGETGVVTQVEGGYLMVKTASGPFEDGEVINGGTSTAYATLSAGPETVEFAVDETITGQTSANTAVVKQTGVIRCDTFSGALTAGEEILGGTSGARATLADPCTNGDVDVTIENENGQRVTGGTLAGAFEYTI